MYALQTAVSHLASRTPKLFWESYFVCFFIFFFFFLTPVTYARLNCWNRFRVSNCTMKVCWPIFGLCSFQDSVINFLLITHQNDFMDLGSFFQHTLWLDLARLLLSQEMFSFGSHLMLLFLSCVCPRGGTGACHSESPCPAPWHGVLRHHQLHPVRQQPLGCVLHCHQGGTDSPGVTPMCWSPENGNVLCAVTWGNRHFPFLGRLIQTPQMLRCDQESLPILHVQRSFLFCHGMCHTCRGDKNVWEDQHHGGLESVPASAPLWNTAKTSRHWYPTAVRSSLLKDPLDLEGT